jgi:hypothetical protein
LPHQVAKDFHMHEIKHAVGAVVAADTQASITALDQAVAQQSRMCASIIEAAHDSNLAIATTQPLLDAMATGLRGLVDSRASLAKAAREVARIQGRSTLRETSFGCPNGLAPWKLSALDEASDAQVVQD